MISNLKKKKKKTFEEQGKKQTDAITNQNKGLEALTNKDDHKNIYEKIFDKLVKEKFDEIRELSDEIDYLNQGSKKVHLKILNCFTNYGKLLLNYLMIILQFHLKLNTK